MNFLRRRRRQPEIQDQPDLDSNLLRQALAGLEQLNFWSRAVQVLWPSLRALARETENPLRVLDVATGAGDIPLGLWRLARERGINIQLDGCDMNPRTVSYAQQQAKKRQANIRFFPLDVLRESIPGPYHVVTCFQFLHHLSNGQAVDILRGMSRAAERMVLVSDLLRGLGGLALAYFSTRFLIHSPVNRIDSVRSVKAAFTMEEVRSLSERAGLEGAVLEKRWPCRFLLTWRRSR